MNALTLSATRRRKPLVILHSIDLSAKSQTSLNLRLSRTLSKAWHWMRCNCTLRRIVSALFSAKVSMAVAVVTVAAMWWHILTIVDNIAAGEAVATDCLIGMPWAIVWAFRASRMPMPEKGGEA